MTVDKLVEQLNEMQRAGKGGHEVIMSKDGEGNSFSPFADLGAYMYKPDSTWSGEITSEEDAKDNGDDGYKENAIVLWPTN